MATIKLSKTLEVSICVESPVLATAAPNNTAGVTSTVSLTDGTYWTVTLTRNGDILTVSVSWNRKDLSVADSNMYRSLSIIPRVRPSDFTTAAISAVSLQGGSAVQGTIDVETVSSNEKYLFDIVLSTGEQPLRKPVKLFGSEARIRDTMKILLKDSHSVDVCFIFDAGKEKTNANVGLWAHSAILSRYKVFAQKIQEASNIIPANAGTEVDSGADTATEDAHEGGNNDEDVVDLGTISTGTSQAPSMPSPRGNNGPALLSIPVEKFSLATFCVLLWHIYTGELKLSIDVNQYAICTIESKLLGSEPPKTKKQQQAKRRYYQDSVRWNPLDPKSPWKFRDVTWAELLVAADYFGITDLRPHCEQAVVSAIDTSNVLETLFTVGCNFEKVRKAAVDFMVKNMSTLVQEGKDPFAPYKNHPDCHDIMFEMMLLKAKPT
ncbi:hypothetical protein BGZ54_003694 [Gamsiella multidivaricata]|nr:hypothetical protein BGZ54_003694 [Gamsiella multidivaricata]